MPVPLIIFINETRLMEVIMVKVSIYDEDKCYFKYFEGDEVNEALKTLI